MPFRDTEINAKKSQLKRVKNGYLWSRKWWQGMEGVLLFSKQALHNYLTLQTMYKSNLGVKLKQNAKKLQKTFQVNKLR